MRRLLYLGWLLPTVLAAQEANSGFDLRTTISGGAFYNAKLATAPRGGDPVTGGFRAMLYPTWKLGKHWTVAGAVQTLSRPWSYTDFSTQGYGVRSNILQGYLCYSDFWNGGSVAVRAGRLSTAFGAFLLRYDDADNPLIDVPMAYGYYYSPVSMAGLTGAEIDVTEGKLDLRAQFSTSSPANPRGLLASDQYGNWTAGAGYTIRQGLRVGASMYHGPYLDRRGRFFFPGESNPVDLPATAAGIDAQWGRGPLNVYGEWQHFQMDYHAIRTFVQHTGYAEGRYVLNPRWYAAARLGYLRSNGSAGRQAYEFVAGFRPNRYQLAKLGYEVQQGSQRNTLAVELVTTFRAISIAHD